MASWIIVPGTMPADAATVWIRPFSPFYTAFQAVYNATAGTFTSVDNSIVYPAYLIYKWRPV